MSHPIEAGIAARRLRWGLIGGLSIALASLAGMSGLRAAEVAMQAPVPILVDRARIITLPEPASTVFVANPAIADVEVPNAPNAMNVIVFGKMPGSTTVFALTASGKIARYDIEVQRALGDAADAIHKQVRGANVEVSGPPSGITISGTADSPQAVKQLKDIARQYVGDKDSVNLDVAVQSSTQVTLHVRVVEVSRAADKNFGFNWNAIFNNGSIAIGLLQGRIPLAAVTDASTGSSTPAFGNFLRSNSTDVFGSLGAGYRSGDGTVNVSSLIDALQSEGLVTVLAEPNLTAISGETASFLAGGEFPVPVPQGLQQITIEWKRFGVNLDFAPIVLSGNRISVKVRPEVSELTDTGSVVINNIKIPALAVRRAETTVELASGQSFAIAGLFQNNVTSSVEQLPGLGDIPVLGALFRSSRFQRHESELVIIVTPYIVRPVAQPDALHTPNEGLAFSGDLDRILRGRLLAKRTQHQADVDPPHLAGPAGFMLEQ